MPLGKSNSRVAIVGTGISGLGCAYFLHSRCDLTLYDQNSYVGGHTNTIEVNHRGESAVFDTGFMVFNHVTYPNLHRFFGNIGVPTQPTDMSFGVQHLPSNLEYCGTGWNGLFAQRRNLVRPRHWRMLRQIDRFNREAIETLRDESFPEMTVNDYVQQRGYGRDFLDLFLIPMSGAVWSTPRGKMLEFPVQTLLRFFHNHGFLGLNTQHPWWTVTGGSREYVRRLSHFLEGRVQLDTPVIRVETQGNGVDVTTQSGKTTRHDKVILACHADQALQILSQPNPLAKSLLGEFQYQQNLATVHTDTTVMPRTRRAWASWNYRMTSGTDGQLESQTIYWMNRLQGVSDRNDYFVSINGGDSIDRSRVLREIKYEHPLFGLGAIRAQKRLPQLNQLGHETGIFFAGSYFRYGFHEDAFTSSVDCCRELTGSDVWPDGRS